jgi:hypothetical protein
MKEEFLKKARKSAKASDVTNDKVREGPADPM